MGKTSGQKSYKIKEESTIRLLFGACWCVYFSTYLGRLNYSACLNEIILSEGFDKSQGGLIGTCFFLAYGVGQLLSGFLGDRLPPKKLVFTGMAVSALANLGMAVFRSPEAMMACWCVNGLFQALVWSPMIRLLYDYLTTERRMKSCLWLNSTVPLGTMTAYGLSALFLKITGNWRTMFVMPFVVLLALAFLWLIAMGRVERQAEVENRGAEKRGPTTAGGPETMGMASGETEAMETGDGMSVGTDAVKMHGTGKPAGGKSSGSGIGTREASETGWLGLLCQSGFLFLMFALVVQGALKDGVTTWIPTYISETYGLSGILSITGTMIIPVFNLLGVCLASVVNQRWFREEVRTASAFFGVCAVSLLVLWLGSGRSMVLSFLMLAVSTTAMMAVNTMLIAVLPSYFGVMGKASSMSGILNSSVYIGGAVSTYGIGLLSGLVGWNRTIFLWLLCAVAAGIICFLVSRVWVKFRKAKLI
ncbi:MAG: MFS transporter [Hungatella hathewayi]|nr:MFS transporter [Hungatella hathewayi]